MCQRPILQYFHFTFYKSLYVWTKQFPNWGLLWQSSFLQVLLRFMTSAVKLSLSGCYPSFFFVLRYLCILILRNNFFSFFQQKNTKILFFFSPTKNTFCKIRFLGLEIRQWTINWCPPYSPPQKKKRKKICVWNSAYCINLWNRVKCIHSFTPPPWQSIYNYLDVALTFHVL